MVNRSEASPPIVGVGTFDQAPYQFLDSTGEPSGLDVEIFKASMVASGLTPHIRVATPGDDTIGPNEVILGASYTLLDETHVATLPYTTTHHTLFANDRSLVRGIEDLRSKQIVVDAHNRALINYLERHGFHNQLTLAESPEHAFSLISEDLAEVAILDTFSGTSTLETLTELAAKIRTVENHIAPIDRTFATAIASHALRAKLESGFRTTVRTGQYDRTLTKYLGSAAHGNRMTFGSTRNVMTTVPVILALGAAVTGLMLALRFSDFKGRAVKKLRLLEEQLTSENDTKQELRLSLARQQFIINRMSTTNLVDVIKEASRK